MASWTYFNKDLALETQTAGRTLFWAKLLVGHVPTAWQAKEGRLLFTTPSDEYRWKSKLFCRYLVKRQQVVCWSQPPGTNTDGSQSSSVDIWASNKRSFAVHNP